jgi:hypothetical protein
MGAAASVGPLDLSIMEAKDVSAYVATLQEGKYAQYAQAFIDEGVDGKLLLNLSKGDVAEILPSLGITNPLHKVKLAQALSDMIEAAETERSSLAVEGADAATRISPVTTDSRVSPITAAGRGPSPENLQQEKLKLSASDGEGEATKVSSCFHEAITKPPSEIMEQMFAIQGVSLDPSDIEVCVSKVVKFLKQVEGGLGSLSVPAATTDHEEEGFSGGMKHLIESMEHEVVHLAHEVGVAQSKPSRKAIANEDEEHYDCFINYRVAADKDVAEKVYYQLKLLGLNPFLDKFCLKPGMVRDCRPTCVCVCVCGCGTLCSPLTPNSCIHTGLESWLYGRHQQESCVCRTD